MPPGREPDVDALRRMAKALVHRGPDDEGVEVVGNVGLVHRRLSIVDPSPAGHQPMRDPGGRWWLTYNGEVFNHLELRQQLLDVAWRGGSDTETLLNALAAWGAAAVPQLNGLFGFAALDTERRRLLLARDRWGVKPLYTARHDGGLWFASEIRTLLAAGVPRRVRPDALSQAIARGWVNGRVTPLEGVFRVLPGTVIEVGLETLDLDEHTFYDPAWVVDADRAAELAGLSDEQRLDAVEGALRAGVRRRLMSDVPLGVMCSGGIDSSLTTAFAAEEQPGLHAFSASITDQPEYDEGRFAAMVADHVGAELHTVECTAETWRRDFVSVVDHVEYPLTHPSSVPMMQIARLAHEHGVKVLLSGEGADELFGGYPWVHKPEQRDWTAHHRRLESVARTAWRRLNRLGIGGAAADDKGPCIEAVAFESEVRRRGFDAYSHHRGIRRRLEGALLADLGTYLPHLLNRQDRTTMQRSIETRVPFLDPDLVELAVNLPLEWRTGPPRKRALRVLADRHVPRDTWDRPKSGFGFDTQAYIESAADPEFLLDGRLRELLAVGSDDWRSRIPALSGHWPLSLWSAEIWCRTVVDGQSVATVEGDLWRQVDAPLTGAGRAES